MNLMVVQNHWFNKTTLRTNTFRQMHISYVLSAAASAATKHLTRLNKFQWTQLLGKCPKKIASTSLYSTMAIMLFIIKTCYWVRFSIINDFLDIFDLTTMPPIYSQQQPCWQPIAWMLNVCFWTRQPLAPKRFLVACHDILMYILYVKNAEKRSLQTISSQRKRKRVWKHVKRRWVNINCLRRSFQVIYHH